MENFENFINELPELDQFAGKADENDFETLLHEELKAVSIETINAFADRFFPAIAATQFATPNMTIEDVETLARFVFNAMLLDTCPNVRAYIEDAFKNDLLDDSWLSAESKATLAKLHAPYSYIMLPKKDDHTVDLLSTFLSAVEVMEL